MLFTELKTNFEIINSQMVEPRDRREPQKDNERHESERHDLEKKFQCGELSGGFSHVAESVGCRDSEINIQQEIGI